MLSYLVVNLFDISKDVETFFFFCWRCPRMMNEWVTRLMDVMFRKTDDRRLKC